MSRDQSEVSMWIWHPRVLACGLTAAIMVCLALGATASTAVASPELEVRSLHMPTNFPPGGTGRYEISVLNDGDEATTGDPLTVTATVPEGMTITEATDPFGGFAWGCSISGDARTAICQLVFAPIEPGIQACQSFAVLCPVVIDVAIAPDASGVSVASIEACGGGSPCDQEDEQAPIDAAPAPFGFSRFSSETLAADRQPSTGAGEHPASIVTRIGYGNRRIPDPKFFLVANSENAKTAVVDLPPGLVGDTTAVPICSREDFSGKTCPSRAQVGTFYLRTKATNGAYPLYNLDPPPGMPVQLGVALGELDVSVFFDASVRAGDHGLTLTSRNLPQIDSIIEANATVWGYPSDSSHDSQRAPCLSSGGKCPVDVPRRPFLTNPTSCLGPREFKARTDSWQNPGAFVSAIDPEPAIVGCDRLPFAPSFSLQAASPKAASPSGYSFEVIIPQPDDPGGLATAHLKGAMVSLPDGVSVSPSAANGLGACAPREIDLGTTAEPTCPASSQIGTVEVQTPLLAKPLDGEVYLAKQSDNPFGSLMALYLVVRGSGVLVKLPGKVEADPVSGRLTATFDENPQLPFSRLRVQLKGGPTAPLVNPSSCGTYTTTARFTPWSAADPDNPTSEETVTLTSSFKITSGPGDTPCPSPGQFDPAFEAGTLTPIAGAYSPLIVNISRPDGSAPLTGLKLDLPEGLVGKLAGIPYCSDATLVAAAGKTGQAELSSSSCPSASKVGTADVGAGAGSSPFHVRGTAYLAGPYKGAPLSIAVITPAVAGPFDLGTVVVRAKADVDPATAQIHVSSDPIPQILQGIPLKVRSVAVDTDKPQFTLNPTDCDPASLVGTLLAPAASKRLASRFQVGACKALDFNPKLAIKLSGPTHRSAHPALRATLTMPKGGANIQRAAVTLPKTEFLEQSHIRTICTRVQYAAKSCPKASIYGYAKAWSPLLDQPLQGPVYLRSSSNPLPDLVASLDGQIHIDLSGRIDTKNARIRNTFDLVPDAPVSKFVLTMQGGRKGLLVNNTELCKAKPRADVKFDGQNGKTADSRPLVKADCGKKGKKRKK
ncbi:MAG TPA: hypothetical protein VFX85_09230 [Solirubrobacterales bacterium]|nr:hypothetical protein [Solirubrobacterales bacterium]